MLWMRTVRLCIFIGYVDVAHSVGQAYGKGDIEKISVRGLRRPRENKAPAQPLGKRAAVPVRVFIVQPGVVLAVAASKLSARNSPRKSAVSCTSGV